METRTYLKRALIFALIGVIIYIGLYWGADRLVYQKTIRNRFFLIKAAAPTEYDCVILGASHAMVLSFGGMNDRLEKSTGLKILNLATLGSGPVVNRLFLDYFLMKHKTKSVIYILDAGPFMKRDSNEGRFDGPLLNRAPFDRGLAALLWSYYRKDLLDFGSLLDYLTGFSKISNGKRFTPDLHEMELIFHRRYRPNIQQIRERIRTTDPVPAKEDLFRRYLEFFGAMIDDLQARNIKVIACKPAIPRLYYESKPNEKLFDSRIQPFLVQKQVPFVDFSRAMPEYGGLYFDTDHLNRNGVPQFFDNHLCAFLKEHCPK